MKRKKHTMKSRSSDRHSGRRQHPFPHEHNAMVGFFGSSRDADGDYDRGGSDNDADDVNSGAPGAGGTGA